MILFPEDKLVPTGVCPSENKTLVITTTDGEMVHYRHVGEDPPCNGHTRHIDTVKCWVYSDNWFTLESGRKPQMIMKKRLKK